MGSTIKRYLLVYVTVFSLCFTMYVTREAQSIEEPNPTDDTDTTSSKPLAVFVVSQCRSGSSILGELFNRRVGVTYLYEPLYPFRGKDCRLPTTEALVPKSIAAVESMARCNFTQLPQLYRDGFRSSKQRDSTKCMQNKLCFLKCESCVKSALFVDRDAPWVVSGENGEIDLVKLGRHCKRSGFFAAKLNYLRGMRNISHLLAWEDVDVKVIHLTRDPRATIRSRLVKIDRYRNRTINDVRMVAKDVCGRLTDNADFVQKTMTSSVNRKQLLSIRHEDFAVDPLPSTKSIYNFVGKSPTPELLSWVRSATDGSLLSALWTLMFGVTGDFGTTRNSVDVVTEWRSWFEFEEVQEIQEICGGAIEILGYKKFHSDAEVRNLSLPSF